MKHSMTQAFGFFLTAGLFFSALPAVGDGYEILGHSQLGTGFAYAGAVSGYGDGSSAHSNPAAMSQIDRTTFNFGLHIVPIQNEFKDGGSQVVGLPNAGTNGGESIRPHPLVDLYAVHPASDDLTLGFALTTPFGLSTKYAEDHFVRYQGQFAELATYKLGPSVAYDVNSKLSIGAGVSAIYSDAKFDSVVDFGTIGFGLLGPATATALGLAPQGNDGKVSISADDWSLGWRVGALWRFDEDGHNRIGLNYRGKTSVDLDGDANYTVPTSAAALNATGAFADGHASSGLTYPEQIVLGGSHRIDDQWNFLWESAWTRWSRFNELRIAFDAPGQADSVTTENWRNTWRHAVGVSYQPNTDWILRTGFSFLRGTITQSQFTTPAIPLGNTYILGAGGSYKFDEDLSLHFGYVHEFIEDQSINRTSPTGDQLLGEFENYVGIISASVVYKLS